ncbi:MAG TPA: hypothetical protein VHF47_11310 [Acidimicrobiales bacterium]|nr:hypothetical protein [Acidimicrobiales bacterium]
MTLRRSRLIAHLIALAALVSGAFIVSSPGAGADTAQVGYADEGWFARNKPTAPQVEIPCETPTGTAVTIPNQGCGPVAPTQVPTPQSKPTGAYVVSSAGGDASDRSNTGGDTGWAAFSWDIFDYIGASVTKFEVKLAQAVDNNGRNSGDTWVWGSSPTPPPIQACNILEGWASEPGSNPWETRPLAGTACVVPTAVTSVTTTGTGSSPPTTTTAVFTFDLTSFAQSWLDGTGFGVVIRPGTPTTKTELAPFQLTFSGYNDAPTSNNQCSAPGGVGCATTKPVLPQVIFEFTPAPEDDFGDDDLGDLDTDGEEFFEDIVSDDEGTFEAVPELDIIPTDVGSEPLPEEAPQEVQDVALPSTEQGRTRPISNTPFPWAILILLPLAVVAFWGTGTALGPMGDPVPARRGGVSRVLAQRQAANGGSDLTRGI